jgi:hypothetical protein
VEFYKKIKEKSGDFDLIILLGQSFKITKKLDDLKTLSNIITPIIIFDDSEIGVVSKHKIPYNESYELLENVKLVGRSGIIKIGNLAIAFLNGRENKKYLVDGIDYHYTSNFFSREDIESLVEENKKLKGEIDILLLNSIPSLFNDEIKKYKQIF